MNLNSLDKTLNFILNTLPCTLAPYEAIKIFGEKKVKKKFEKKMLNEIFLELNIVISSGASIQR